MKPAAVLFTGGKDSCLALFRAKQGGYNIKYLLAVLPESYDSWMWHKPFIDLLEAQAKSLGIPLIVQNSDADKEKKLNDLEHLFEKVKGKVECIVTGGVASKYQGDRIGKAAKKFGFEVILPIWHIPAQELWQECIKNNFKIVITKISCDGIPPEMLNKPIDPETYRKLLKLSKEYSFDIIAEGGDFETTVLDMPLFKKEIEVSGDIESEGAYRHFFMIKKVKLLPKKGSH